jgi:hypothetical protein
VDPDPAIVSIREELGADFGKFDYVMHDGRAVLIDANKTPGGTGLRPTRERMARWRERAAGIRVYL